MDILIAALGQFGLGHEVVQCNLRFHLGHSDDGSTVGQFVCAEFGEHFGHIAEFALILHGSPLVFAFGQVFPVVTACGMDGVEEVFQVVERHAIECVTLVLTLFVAIGKGGEQHEGGDNQE